MRSRVAESERRFDYRDPEWLAEQLDVDKSTIYRYLQDGTLPGLQLGRKWLVSERQLMEFLDAEARRQTEVRRQEREGAVHAARGFFGLAGSRDRYDKFSERARQALRQAQEEARALRHNFIGTEHILLGLGQGDGVAVLALRNLGAESDRLRSAVLSIVTEGPTEPPPSGDFGLTRRGKKTIELAVAEAARMNHSYVGTEHLLLGLLREGDGVAAGILRSMGIELDGARSEVKRLLSSGPKDAASGA
jgi:excisionase family DNA binding protein